MWFRRSTTDKATADPAATTGGAAAAAAGTAPADDGPESPRPQGKGRPTPTRKEAEAAARARAKAALDPKASRRQERAFRAERSRDIRRGIREGDERYLPKRDRGPVRRFVRDYVDHRLSMAEFTIPLLISSLFASSAGAVELGSGIMNMTILVVIVDSLFLRWRMRKEIKARFGAEHLKGTTFYAFMRALQLRFLRLPKPKVKLGQKLPADYGKPSPTDR